MIRFFALTSDKKNRIYLSLREYNEETNIYKTWLLKIDSNGKVLAEYDLEDAHYKQDKTAGDMLAYKMVTDEKGNLYVKCRNCPETVIFMFDSDYSVAGKNFYILSYDGF